MVNVCPYCSKMYIVSEGFSCCIDCRATQARQKEKADMLARRGTPVAIVEPIKEVAVEVRFKIGVCPLCGLQRTDCGYICGSHPEGLIGKWIDANGERGAHIWLDRGFCRNDFIKELRAFESLLLVKK